MQPLITTYHPQRHFTKPRSSSGASYIRKKIKHVFTQQNTTFRGNCLIISIHLFTLQDVNSIRTLTNTTKHNNPSLNYNPPLKTFYYKHRGIPSLMCHLYMQALREAAIFAAENSHNTMPDIGISVHKTDSSVVFERVFKEHFKNLHAYACSILKDSDEAEEMVQNVFYKLWEKKEKIGELQSIPAYLYRSVYNECMNYVKHEKVKQNYESHAVHHGAVAGQAVDTAETKELEKRIGDALEGLPEQCRTIFQMSRFEELKYREIADKLGLSVKTIENQMGKALKILRTKLADYINVVWLLLITLLN